MLNSNKGITLASLVIYIIVLMIVVALMSNFSGYFYKNLNIITIKEESDEQFTRLLAYLTKDLNQENIRLVKCGQDDDIKYIIIKLEENVEHQYLYNNNTIYYVDKDKEKKICLCDSVNSCEFIYKNTYLTLNIKIDDKYYLKTISVNIDN